ncbi:MAG: hypothetical protein K2M19_01195 [Muribaculaceae bacterium]|nr:hypothetical protein [Muribaculaceae bacterium]
MKHTEPYIVVLADCAPDEVQSFADGISDVLGRRVVIESSFKKKFSKKTLTGMIRYYSNFFSFAFRAWRHRNRYSVILAWQQFYAQNFAFYSRLTATASPKRTLISVNYTYKTKSGLLGKIYSCYMKFCARARAMTYIHVLSPAYARRIENELGVSSEKLLVTHFGTPDRYDSWSMLPSPYDGDYVLSIGRSNRDFDYLCEVWRQPCLKDYRLVIIADLWQHVKPLPENVIHLTDVIGDQSFPYIANAVLSVVPIKDPLICSGDTVLLNSMMMKVPVAVSAPSTLSEMYVTDTTDGIYLKRDAISDARLIADLLNSPEELKKLGEAARHTYIERFSRKAMGQAIARELIERGL